MDKVTLLVLVGLINTGTRAGTSTVNFFKLKQVYMTCSPSSTMCENEVKEEQSHLLDDLDLPFLTLHFLEKPDSLVK